MVKHGQGKILVDDKVVVGSSSGLQSSCSPCAEAALGMLLQGYDSPGLQSLHAKREEVFTRLHQVAARVYPSQTALPLDHIALRLEQMSAGMWPQTDNSPLTDSRAVPEALVKVCTVAACA